MPIPVQLVQPPLAPEILAPVQFGDVAPLFVQMDPPGRRVLSLTGANGDSIILLKAAGYRVPADGVRGLGWTPRTVKRRTGAGVGSRKLGVRREERVVDLPVHVTGETVREKETRLQRLEDILDDRYGDPVFTVASPSGVRRSIACTVLSGMERQQGASLNQGGPLHQFCPLVLLATDPDWLGEVTSGPIALLPSAPFIPFGGPMTPGARRVAGTMELDNPGDLDAYIVWTITGPGGPIRATSVTDGLSWELSVPLTAGQVRVVDTGDAGYRSVVDGAGVNKYNELAATPRLWTLPPGRSTATVQMTNATAASSIRYRFVHRHRSSP